MSIKEYLTVIDLDNGSEVIINPLINPYAFLEKIKKKVVYNPRLRKYCEVAPRLYTIPVYLPELGFLLALDMSSEHLARRLYDETKEFNGIMPKNRIFYCRIHNFQRDHNRVVSWGTIKPLILSESLLRLYIINLLNDFSITPSIVQRGQIISPHRWFFISSEGLFKFESFLNYNLGIIYIDRKNVELKRKRKIWINFPIEVYEVKSGFVLFHPSGFIKYIKPIPLHFTEDPSKIEFFTERGDYFLCSLISLNNYLTSYKGFDFRLSCINIVESLSELVFSPLQILPFLFPFSLREENELNKLVFSFSIRKEIFHIFYNRLIKFSGPQNPSFIDFYEDFLSKWNKLLILTEDEDSYYIKMVNPSIVPFLLKKLHEDEVSKWEKGHIIKLLEEPNILERIENLKRENWIDFLPLRGVKRPLSLRAKILKKYIDLYKTIFFKINNK